MVALALLACACGSDGGDQQPPAPVAVLSAFPAELAAVLAHASVTGTVEIEGRVFRIGVMGGRPVVAGVTGIGLANAATITEAVLDRFAVAGVVVSGVAGSTLPIGDVAVPTAWTLKDGTTFTADAQWLELATGIAAAGTVVLEQCTQVPTAAVNPVCLSQVPAVVVGGVGQSTDPFHGMPFPCQVGGDDLYGCDVPAAVAGPSRGALRAVRVPAAASAPPSVNDMETAAIARAAAARRLPFIAFRAVSDGAGDPLNLPNSLDQFAAYYHLAARNAAAAAAAFVQRLNAP